MPPSCNTISKRICQEGHANALALNRDCTQIAVAGRSLLKVYSIEPDGFVEVCNMRGGKNQNLSYSSNDVAWSTIDHNLLATAATNGVISVWDLSKFGRQKQLYVYNEHERTAHTVTFHGAEPNLLISGSQDGTIKCFDLRCDKAVHTYHSNAESVRDVKFSPQQPNQFAAVSENGTVQLWDLKRPDRCALQFTAHSGPVYTCDWHPTQPWLATGSRDRQIKVWRMDHKPSLEYNIHTIAVVGRVKWRPDRQHHIASCALVVDYSIYIWDVRRPYIPYAAFTEHTNVTTGIAFKGSDPHVLMSASKDSTIFKHSFQDATRPTTKTNPQATSFNLNGDLLFSFKVKNPGVATLHANGDGAGGQAGAISPSSSSGPGGGVLPVGGSVAAGGAPATPRSSGAGAFIADTINSVCSTPRSTTTAAATATAMPAIPASSAQIAAAASAAAAAAANAAATLAAEQFHMAKSCLISYTTGNADGSATTPHRSVGGGGLPREYDAFRGCARDYILTGGYLPDICEYNADIARKYGKANVSMLWRFVGNQYAHASSTSATAGGDVQRKSIGAAGGAGGRLNKMHHRHHHHHHHHHASANSVASGKTGGGGGGDGGEPSEQDMLAQMCCEDLKLQEFRHPKSGEFKHSIGAVGGVLAGGADGKLTANPAVLSSSSSSASAALMLAEQSAADSLASHMHGEAEELTVHEVKGLRNGFLYIGPHDLTKGWSLPHNNLNELQTKKAAQDMEAESRQQAQEEGTLLPEPPSVLKLSAQPTFLGWQPHDVLTDGLQLQTDIGDVQTAVCILIAMGDRRAELPIDDLTHEAWLLSYIELLHRHQLWTEATEIVNLAWIHSVRDMNQQSTTMHTSCGDCGRPLNASAGWFCTRCKSARAADCAVCNRPVHGLYAWCQGCAHGGHLEHIRQWFSDHSKCPKCGHMCEHD